MDARDSTMHPQDLILASASPRRSELLRRIGLHFKTCPADVDELDCSTEGPRHLVVENARLKAAALADQFPDSLILGSDTTVALGESVFNKPSDMDQARIMLRQLSGRAHTVYTGVALIWKRGDLYQELVESSTVCFKQLDEACIDAYFALVNPLDKAGAYGIQAGRELIIESVEGAIETVMGLPIEALRARLLQLGFDFRESK